MSKLRKILAPVLYPISLLYAFVMYIRNRLYDYNIIKSNKFKIPIISVGNITVGGTGKTPHIEYLIELLKDEFNVATISRGYKRKTKGFVLANQNSTVADIGDEPRQIKQKFPEINVAVDADRTNAIKTLKKKIEDLDIVLLDDAFQHRKVDVNLSILLIDYSRPITKDFILPLGNLREQVSEKRRANMIIVTKTPQDLKPIEQRVMMNNLDLYPFQHLYFSSFDYSKMKLVFDQNTQDFEHQTFANYKILLLSGIANPKSLKEYIAQNISEDIVDLEYPDHYNFKKTDVESIIQTFNSIDSEKKIIITTEKDAMRLQKFSNIADELKSSFFYIPVKIKFLNNRADSFNQQIIEYVRKNKKHSFLYPG